MTHFISLNAFKIFSSEVYIFSLQTKNVMSPAKWENKEWCIHYWLQPPLMVDPEGNSGLRQNKLSAISLCSHPTPMVHSEGIGTEKNRTVKVHIKGTIGISPDSCIFSQTQLNSLTEGVWFSINSSSSDYLIFVYKNFPCIWLHPSLFKTIPQSYLRLFFCLSPLQVCQIKQFSTFRVCMFFPGRQFWWPTNRLGV